MMDVRKLRVIQHNIARFGPNRLAVRPSDAEAVFEPAGSISNGHAAILSTIA